MNLHPTALAVYGTLAPGETNHWVLNRIKGDWTTGTIRGHVFEVTWGPAEGYLGYVPDAEGAKVAVAVLISDELSSRWREVDDFLGTGFERVETTVVLDDGRNLNAFIHVALTDI